MLIGATPQGMLLYNHSVRIYGDAVGPKYPLGSAINGRGMPKLTGHFKAHLICRNWEATKSYTQDGSLIKREDCILPITQVKGTHLDMKPPHQSLLDPMPHGV